MADHIRVAQINAQRSVMVLNELRKLIDDLKLDILCIQEPYTCKGMVPHMPATARIISHGQNPMAAIIVINKDIKVTCVSQLCDSHTNCIEIYTTFGKCILANSYFQFREDLDLAKFRKVCEVYSNTPFILMAHAHSKSTWWYSNFRDLRGEEIEDFISEFRLNIETNRSIHPRMKTTMEQAQTLISLWLMIWHMKPLRTGKLDKA